MLRRRICTVFAVLLILLSVLPCQAMAVGTSATSSILMDVDSGRVLYEHNADKQMLIASTTKILTALVAIREGDLDDVVNIPDNPAIEDLFMHCLYTKSMVYLIADETDENYQPYEREFREAWYNLLDIAGIKRAPKLVI